MKILWFVFTLFIGVSVCIAAETNEVHVLSHTSRGKACEWYLPLKILESLPKWNPMKEPVPFPVEKAVQMANKWIKTSENIDFEPDLRAITLRPILIDNTELKYIYIYIVEYETRIFQSRQCVVLMDGTILEPRSKYGSSQK